MRMWTGNEITCLLVISLISILNGKVNFVSKVQSAAFDENGVG